MHHHQAKAGEVCEEEVGKELRGVDGCPAPDPNPWVHHCLVQAQGRVHQQKLLLSKRLGCRVERGFVARQVSYEGLYFLVLS